MLDVLEAVAPLHLAENWDNVGMLVDSQMANEFHQALLTIDTTSATLSEAKDLGVDLIISYHPLIFSPLKRLRAEVAQERILLDLIRGGFTLYSPHTALDAARDGMNDWLAGALGQGRVAPIVPHATDPSVGAGRKVELGSPLSLSEALSRISQHLGLKFLRVAAPSQPSAVKTWACCPGAGGGLFEKLGKVDLLLTGEMRHHDILRRLAEGTTVVVTDHTNTERGYLPLLAARLSSACPGLRCTVSQVDKDPLLVRAFAGE